MLFILSALSSSEWRIDLVNRRLRAKYVVCEHLPWRSSSKHVFINDVHNLLVLSRIIDVS